MNVTAITVCIDFCKWLKKCISNKELLSRWIIVTHASDLETINFCKDNNIEYILSKRIFVGDSLFAKGKAINEALNQITNVEYILSLDADILLPSNFNEILSNCVHDKSYLYGSRRYDHRDKCIQQDSHNNKIMPYGFFQLWHTSQKREYSEISDNAIVDDWAFSLSFKEKTEILPLKCKNTFEGVGYDKRTYNGLRNINYIQ